MILGSVMLIKTDAPFLQISWSVILPVVGTAAGLSLLIVGMGMRAMRRRPVTGVEGMVGRVGIARTALMPRGQILIHGEIWEALSDHPLQSGDSVEVVRMEGLTLYVKPAPK
jgi:membrane-bound serine protease (ClpP class)